jgi:subtilase family serine protease
MTSLISRRIRRFAAGVLLGLLAGSGGVSNASAQTQGGMPVLPRFAPGTLFEPASNFLLTRDFGKRAHSNLRILVPPSNSFARAQIVAGAPPFSNYLYETPASLACIYNLVPPTVAGCNPNATKTGVTSGSKSIGIVDAYDYAAAQTDLATFSSQFGLPAPSAANFKVVYATGAKPPSAFRTGWDLEAALDLDMAHGQAPKAKLYLVEAASNSLGDLFQAVSKAASLVAGDGGGEVSMSWGAGEFSGEIAYDGGMTTSKVVYLAAAGDNPGTIYPCTSPNVVCVGGTGNSRNVVTGAFQGNVAWADTGGRTSLYEARPAYQNALSGIVGAKRGVPDIAAVADPRTGVWVYIAAWAGSCVGNSGWCIVGGTSVATPVMAAIMNSAGAFPSSSAAALNAIYSTAGAANETDVTNGACGYYDGFTAAKGWDQCTGIGVPLGGTNLKVVVIP